MGNHFDKYDEREMRRDDAERRERFENEEKAKTMTNEETTKKKRSPSKGPTAQLEGLRDSLARKAEKALIKVKAKRAELEAAQAEHSAANAAYMALKTACEPQVECAPSSESLLTVAPRRSA